MSEKETKLNLLKDKIIEYLEYTKNEKKQKITIELLNDLLKEVELTFPEKRELKGQIMTEYMSSNATESFKQDKNLFYGQNYIKNIKNFDFDSLYSKFFQKIYNNWGFGAMSYFKFMKFLMILNLIVFVISFIFLAAVPILGDGRNRFNSTCPEYRAKPTLKIVKALTAIFTGDGFMESSFIFYAKYKYPSYSLSLINRSYNMQLGYPLVILCCYGISLIYLGAMLSNQSKTAAIYKNIRNTELNFSQIVYIQKKFNNHISDRKFYLRRFQMEIFHRHQQEKLSRTKITLAYIIMRVLIGFITLGLIGGCAILIYYANKLAVENSDNYLVEFSPSFLFILFDLIFPMVLNFFQYLEKYRGNTAILVKLVRLVLFRTVPLFVYIYFVFNFAVNEKGCSGCWETQVGKSLYKILFSIMIFDLLYVLIVTPIKIIVTKRYPEFFLMDNIIQLIKMQLLQWIMTIFVPLISTVTLLFQTILIFIKYIELKYLTSQSLIPLNYIPSDVFFTGVLLIVFNVKCFISLYIFFRLHTSPVCGPFRGLSLFESLAKHMAPLTPGFFGKFVFQDCTLIAIGILFISLVIMLYCKLRILNFDYESLKRTVDMKKNLETRTNEMRVKYYNRSKVYKKIADDYVLSKNDVEEYHDTL